MEVEKSASSFSIFLTKAVVEKHISAVARMFPIVFFRGSSGPTYTHKGRKEHVDEEVFHQIQGRKGPRIPFFPVWVPVDTFPLLLSYYQFLQALPLFTMCRFV